MDFTLIICTFQRPHTICRLLESVNDQSLYPNEILVVDASYNQDTKEILAEKDYRNLQYFKVEDKYRGLTLQRNFGISRVNKSSEIVCYLDDDIVLESTFFEYLIGTYKKFPDALAVGAWINGETAWKKVGEYYTANYNEFIIDGYVRKLGSRNVFRKCLGLLSDKPPGFMPDFSHGFSTGFLPPSGKIYEVEYFMGGVSSYKKSVFQKIKFSEEFIGYGLYEDMDYCLRLSRLGKLYVNTSAKVTHLHEESGRPDYYKYGRMVIENGFHVWRLKYKDPKFSGRIKWTTLNVLLLLIRFFNGIKDRNALNDAKGRLSALIGLLIKR